tara:strand:- start:180 stop:1016 length:837 start_codon:yes stop_codon:yes gene_type:complete
MRILITLASASLKEKIENREPISNEFVIDVVTICEMANKTTEGGPRQWARRALERLYFTTYHISLHDDNPIKKSFSDAFGIEGNETKLRFLAGLSIANDREQAAGSVRHPRFFKISFENDIYEDLKNKIMFVDPYPLLMVSDGMVHLIYSWLNYTVKRSGDRVVTQELSQIHEQITPSMNLSSFSKKLITSLANFANKNGQGYIDNKKPYRETPIGNGDFIVDPGVVNLFGYIIEIWPSRINKSKYQIRAYRDKKDIYIGDNSIHNLLNFKEGKTLGV